MRTQRRNKQRMAYALYLGKEPKYKLDENGDKVISYVSSDGIVYYEEEGERETYSDAEFFEGHISMSGGEVGFAEYGVNNGDYSAVLLVEKNSLPIDETSLIWFETIPDYDDEEKIIPTTADYRVVKKSPSLNLDKFILQKIVK